MTETNQRLTELAKLFTRLGFTAFGGPAAHIAMMHDEVVVRRQWLDVTRHRCGAAPRLRLRQLRHGLR